MRAFAPTLSMDFFAHPLPYLPDAAPYFAALVDLPHAVWLDSAGRGRYDILVAAPLRVLHFAQADADAFAALRAALGDELPPLPDVPFAGGLLGYWGYDGDATLGLYDWAVLVDHQQQQTRLVSRLRHPDTAAQLPAILARLQNPPTLPANTLRVHAAPQANFTPASYAAAFARVQDYLHAGDCYQINLAQRFSAPASGDAFGAYLHLRQLSPAPFSAYLNFPGLQVLCASPERFLRVENGAVETKPIKGTRRRLPDPAADAAQITDLCQHPKDRAENLMIVDLLRNDLSQHCHSVRVPSLFAVESFAQVHHLVSTITGQLRPGRHALDVLRASFPGGSITGAPKRRAMQIIAELEPHPRELYCGSIAYLGWDGQMDSNIVIRTLLYRRGEICAWAGGGLVADSDCAAEYQETLDKAGAMLTLLRAAQG